MNKNQNQLFEWAELDCDSIDFDELESKLNSELEEQITDLEGLEIDREKIGNPDTIGNTIMNVVWEQFVNQVGVIAGEDFIKENRGMTLDLRDSAHIQTTENFATGKLAKHNDKIDYQKRYDDWQENFQYDEYGNVLTHKTRSGKEEATLVRGARIPFDQRRPVGSVERGTDMDHTVSAGEIIRDPVANAHLTKDEQIAFANSAANLNEINASHNRSKGDKTMSDWLDNPNSKGQTPKEIYADAMDKTYLSPEKEQEYRNKDAEARAEYEKEKKEGVRRSVETGKKSQKEEAIRIGGKALRSAVMGLLASLIKDIIRKLISWFRTGNRTLSTFIDSIKEAIKSFVSNLKEHLLNAGNSLVTAIFTAIFGPVIGMIKKAWIFLKQGYKSVKEAIIFLKDPTNKNIPFSLKMMEVGKIVIVGLTAGGAILLSEVIEKGLLYIPGFSIDIPLLGSLASLVGMFLGALVSGLIGALALNQIDRLIAKKLKRINTQQQIEKKNEILAIQSLQNRVEAKKVEKTRDKTTTSIKERHAAAAEIIEDSISKIMSNSKDFAAEHIEDAEVINGNSTSENNDALDSIFADLRSLS